MFDDWRYFRYQCRPDGGHIHADRHSQHRRQNLDLYQGTGFTYDAFSNVTGGTVARFDLFDATTAQTLASYSNVSIPVITLVALLRAPDTSGHLIWTARITSGERSLLDVVQSFVNSAEFRNTYGTTNNTGFVTLLYNNVLDRAPGPHQPGDLARPPRHRRVQPRAGVERFAQSAEFVTKSTPDLIAWMKAQGTDDRLDGWGGTNIAFGGIGADSFLFYQVWAMPPTVFAQPKASSIRLRCFRDRA